MTRYIIMVTMGAMSYGTLSSFAKIAYTEGYTAGEITFTQAFLGALILWALAIFRSLRQRKFKLVFNWKLVLAGATMGISAYCFYLSVKYIPVSLAIVLLMQVSWMSNLGDWLVHKRKLSAAELTAMLIVIPGTILAGNLLNISDLNISLVGIGLALVAAFFYTLYVLFTSELGNDIPMLEKSALMTTGSAIMILLVNFPSIVSSVKIDLGLMKWGTFLAVFGTVIPPICFTTGMPKIGPGLSSILLTLELPAVVLSAYLILGEQVAPLQITGILVMVVAIIYLNLSRNNGMRKEALDPQRLR